MKEEFYYFRNALLPGLMLEVNKYSNFGFKFWQILYDNNEYIAIMSRQVDAGTSTICGDGYE